MSKTEIDYCIGLLKEGVSCSTTDKKEMISYIGFDEDGNSVFNKVNKDDVETGRTTDMRVVRDWLK